MPFTSDQPLRASFGARMKATVWEMPYTISPAVSR